MKKLKGMSGFATVVLTTGLATTTQAEEVKEVLLKTDEVKETKVNKADLDKLKKDLADSQEKLSEQEKAVTAAEVSQNTAASEVAALEEVVVDLDNLVETATPEVVAEVEANIATTEQELAEAEKVVALEKEGVANQESAVVAQDEVLKVANAQLESAERSVGQAEASVAQAEANLTEAQKEVLEQNLATSKQSVVDRQAEVEAAKTALTKAEQADAQHAGELSKLASETEKATALLKANEVALREATEQKATSQGEVDALQLEVAQLKNTIVQLQESQGAEKTAAIKELELALDKLSAAQAELKTAQDALVLAEQSEKQRQKAISDARVRLQQEQANYNSARAELERITREYYAAKPNPSPTSVPYYSQTDPHLIRHVIGLSTFGATGCAPTALAMIFSELLARPIAPLEVANWLYHNTNDFNKLFTGTAGVGILKATKAYGLESKVLSSHDRLVQSLKEGHLVYAAVENNKFSPWGPEYSHAIVLKGYSNGNTYVYDPYTRANIGWYPVANLWREQSTSYEDTVNVGAPFIQISSSRLAQLGVEKNSLAQRFATQATVIAALSRQLSSLENQANPLVAATNRVNEKKALVKTATDKVTLAKSNQTRLVEVQTQVAQRLASYQSQLVAKEALLDTANTKLESADKALKLVKTNYDKSRSGFAALRSRYSLVASNGQKLPAAKTALLKASERLDQATVAYEAAQVALDKYNAAKGEKEALLVAAKADLATKKLAQDQARDMLKQELAKYMALKDSRDKARVELHKQEELVASKTALIASLKSKLSSWKEAQSKLDEKKLALVKAKEELAVKKDAAVQELLKLKTLQDKHEATKEHYEQLQKVYDAYLEAERQAQLVADFEAIKQSGGIAVPVVDETGSVVTYLPETSDKIMPESKPQVEVLSSKSVSSVSKTSSAVVGSRVAKGLPKTGDSSSLLALGIASIGLAMGLVGIRRKEN